MVSTKLNTKMPESSNQGWKTDNNKIASADQLKDVLGDKELGQVLNEISDPNYVDPKKARRPESKMDKEGFLKLLLTQLKFQDPMNPLESHEMAAQLAQFSSLEQLSNINTNIEGLTKAQTPVHNYQALNFMGKTITSDTEKIMRNKGDKTHELRFTIPEAAKELKITIRDETGTEVKTLKTYATKRGENKVVWNGTKEDGYPAFSGNYTFTVEGQSEKGNKLVGRTSFSGVVTGMNFSPEGPVLMIGDQKVRISDIKTIEDQAQKFAQDTHEMMRAQSVAGQPVQGVAGVPTATPAAAPVVAPKTEVEGAPERPKGNIDLVPMASDLKDNVAKAVKSVS